MKEYLIPFVVVAALIIMDILTGFAKAAHAGAIDSTTMREGLWHKGTFVAIIALAVLLEYGSRYIDLGFNVALTVPACVYVALTEVVSIIENLTEINPNLKGSKLLALFNRKEES